MFTLGEIAFRDNVSVVDAPPTRQSGHATLVGVCYGVTTPSVSSVEVIGDAFDDVGLNVHFENDAVPDAWFALQLVTLVDHAVGSHATVGDRSFVETADGAWVPTTPAGEVVGPIPVEAGWPMAPCQGCQPGCAVQRLHRHGGNGGTSIQAGAYGGSGRGRPGGDGVQQ